MPPLTRYLSRDVQVQHETPLGNTGTDGVCGNGNGNDNVGVIRDTNSLTTTCSLARIATDFGRETPATFRTDIDHIMGYDGDM